MEMMKYVEDYSVSTRIDKDLSRLGREYSCMGRLQDLIFPAYDVRFIAVNDDVDSAKGENDLAVFKNVFNDYYVKDTSKKIQAVVKMRGEAGEHLTSNLLTDISKVLQTKINGWWTKKRQMWCGGSSACTLRAKAHADLKNPDGGQGADCHRL